MTTLSDAELGAAVRAARDARDQAKNAVVDWFEQAGREGRLVTYGQAPGWSAYEAAEAALALALKV